MSKAIDALNRGLPGAKAEEDKLEPSALWAAFTALPRPTKTVPLPRNIPGTNEPVGFIKMWPLTQEEQMAVNAEADRWTKALMKEAQRKDEANFGYVNTYSNEVAIQVLHRACREVEDVKKPAFPSTKEMRKELTTDEVGILWDQYCAVQSELGPIRAYLSPEETEALVIRLVEGGSAFPIESLSSEARRTLVLTLASQLMSFWTATCSYGSAPGVSSYVRDYLDGKYGEQPSESEEVTVDTDTSIDPDPTANS